MNTNACIVLTTCGNRDEAERIAETVVNEHLAACVNVISPSSPVRSFYFWEGVLQKDEEYLLLIKTLTAGLPLLEKRIGELHSYTVPEFIALPIIAGSDPYLQWLNGNVQ